MRDRWPALLLGVLLIVKLIDIFVYREYSAWNLFFAPLMLILVIVYTAAVVREKRRGGKANERL